MEIFDPIINEINKQGEMEEKNDPYQGDSTFEEEGLDKESVCLASACLGKLFNNKLVIPDYQRNYCWQDKQVNDLWNQTMANHPTIWVQSSFRRERTGHTPSLTANNDWSLCRW